MRKSARRGKFLFLPNNKENHIMEFNINKIALKYENVIQVDDDTFKRLKYNVLDRVGNVAGEIVFDEMGCIFIFVDNFPAPKKYCSSSIPQRSWEHFESDIERAGLKLIKESSL